MPLYGLSFLSCLYSAPDAGVVSRSGSGWFVHLLLVDRIYLPSVVLLGFNSSGNVLSLVLSSWVYYVIKTPLTVSSTGNIVYLQCATFSAISMFLFVNSTVFGHIERKCCIEQYHDPMPSW